MNIILLIVEKRRIGTIWKIQDRMLLSSLDSVTIQTQTVEKKKLNGGTNQSMKNYRPRGNNDMSTDSRATSYVIE